MPITRCTLATVRGRLIAALNSAPAATWVTTITSSDDNRRNPTELDNIILAADARICVARASKVGDGYRSLFLALSASIAHAGMIPDHLGPIEQVTIKAATIDATYKTGKFDSDLTLADIERWRANAGGRYGTAHDVTNSPLAGFYIRRGSQLFYTGADAKCLLATFTRSAACQAPDTDEDMLLGLAIGDAYKEGDMGQTLTTLVADARAEYGNLLKQSEPNPSETVSLVAA
jgi:hypothetical protein